jgi:pimeloyl-ACP methyl ester carboxylesterase
VLPLLAVAAAAGCSLGGADEESSTGADRSAFATSDCPVGLAAGFTCGFLTVPENRAREGGGSIRLAVAVGRSRAERPAADAVLYLSGGPGTGGLFHPYRSLFDELRERRDIVLLDQRGTGLSKPSLDCPELDALTIDGLGRAADDRRFQARVDDALLACRQRLRGAGVDLAAYHSAAIAADVEDLRRALGYRRWNLVGLSYGSRLALAVMRDFPASVRSAVLDSALPPRVDPLASQVEITARAFDRLFDACAAARDCSTAHPRLRARWIELLERLEADPVTITVGSTPTGEPQDVRFDAHSVPLLVRVLLDDEATIGLVPALIEELEQGRFGIVAERGLDLVAAIPAVSEGMTFSVFCADEVAFADRARIRRELAAVPPELGRLDPITGDLRACELWDVPAAPARERAPVTSDVPTLVLAGEFDPRTPPAWGRLAARTLSRSVFHELPALGHPVLRTATGCPDELARAFVERPSTPPDAGCIGAMGPPFWR